MDTKSLIFHLMKINLVDLILIQFSQSKKFIKLIYHKALRLSLITSVIINIKMFIWNKVFKNGPSNICGRQHLKNLKGFGLLQSIYLQMFQRLSCTNFNGSILEYFVPFLLVLSVFLTLKLFINHHASHRHLTSRSYWKICGTKITTVHSQASLIFHQNLPSHKFT